MSKENRTIENHPVYHPTPFHKLYNLYFSSVSSDEFLGQSSWIPFVRRTRSRRTMSWNSRNLCGEKA